MFPVADRNRSDSSGGRTVISLHRLVHRLVYHLHKHVFSEGIHGLSVATEEWLEQNIGQEEGKRYTQEQVQMLAEAIEAGETPFPKEKGEELLVKFGIGRKKPARWTEKQKEGIRKTLKEVQSWTQLAEVWMEKISESGIEENKGYRHFKTVWQSNL